MMTSIQSQEEIPGWHKPETSFGPIWIILKKKILSFQFMPKVWEVASFFVIQKEDRQSGQSGLCTFKFQILKQKTNKNLKFHS